MSKVIDNLIFGKEIKALNLLTNIEYNFEPKVLSGIALSDWQYAKKTIKSNIIKYGEKIRSNIKYITRPIYNAWENNETKIVDLKGTRDKLPPCSGVNIFSLRQNGKTVVFTCYYHFDFVNQEILCLVFIDNDLVEFLVCDEDYITENKTTPYDPKKIFFHNFNYPRPLSSKFDGLDIQLELDWLVRYIDVEIQQLKARGKNHNQECKYENHTNLDIQIINSSYFQDIVRLEGFGVKGHFRWQAHGEGHKDRKLIWVSDYMKNGYQRKSKRGYETGVHL